MPQPKKGTPRLESVAPAPDAAQPGRVALRARADQDDRGEGQAAAAVRRAA